MSQLSGKINMRTIPLSELKPAEYNPRKMNADQRKALESSLEQFGLVQPIIWNEKSGNVVGGHQRLTSLLDLGVEETDVVVVNLDDAKEKQLNVTLNNAHVSGDFTDDILDLIAEIEDSIEVEDFVGIGLDALEGELAKEFGGKQSFDFGEDTDDEEELGRRSSEADASSLDDVQNANTKMVQLFLNTNTHPEFEDMIIVLGEKFGTTNVTDTVMATLRNQVNNLH